MKNILITGTNSGLGKFLSQKVDAFCLFTLNRGDDIDQFARVEFDTIIHCAANVSHPNWSNVDEGFLNDNFLLTQEILKLSHKKFIYISSICVSTDAAGATKPTPYSTTKIMSEGLVRLSSKDSLIIRPAGLIGPGMKENTFTKILAGKPIALRKDSVMNYVSYNDVWNLIEQANLIASPVVELVASRSITIEGVAKSFNADLICGDFHFDIGIDIKKTNHIQRSSYGTIRDFLNNSDQDSIKTRLVKCFHGTGIDVGEDLSSRIDQLVECATDRNAFNDLDEILSWIENEKKSLVAYVKPVQLRDCRSEDQWVNREGNLEHATGGFFKIIGVETVTEVTEGGKSWCQPFIDQGTEAGVIGLLKKDFDGIPHYLIQAKFEPGNYGRIQLAATCQATYDNINQLHEGRRPLYADHFTQDLLEGDLEVFAHWYSEDGGRFFKKRLLNMVRETYSEIHVGPHHIWATMFQIKQLLKRDNIVSSHLRSVISYL